MNETQSPILTATYSELGKLAACPRQWYWAEYQRLTKKIQPATGPLPFGTRVHTALELWGNGKIDSPIEAWNPLMKQEYDWHQLQGFPTEDLDKESKIGHAMLSNFPAFLDAEGFWDRYEIVHVEHVMKEVMRVNTVYGPVDIVLQGKADVIVRRKLDGMHFVLDWKTTQSVAESVLTVMAKSPQFRIYARLAKKENPGLLFGGALVMYLRKVQQTVAAKPPFYAVQEIPMSKYDMDEYNHRLVGVVTNLVETRRKLDAGGSWRMVTPLQPSRINCPSCLFRAPCDMMASFPQGAVDLLANDYIEYNPLARYDKDAADSIDV